MVDQQLASDLPSLPARASLRGYRERASPPWASPRIWALGGHPRRARWQWSGAAP